METQVIEAKHRSKVGKNGSKALRGEGQIPAVIYGNGGENLPVVVNNRQLVSVYRGPLGRNTPIVISVEGENGASKETVISYRVDRNPLSLAIEHVDFLRVSEDSKVEMTVPLKLIGSAPGVKLGGMMRQHISEVKIEVAPQLIPSAIQIDLSGLGVNEAIKVQDIKSDSFRVLSQPNQIIVAVTAKGKAAEETAIPTGKKK